MDTIMTEGFIPSESHAADIIRNAYDLAQCSIRMRKYEAATYQKRFGNVEHEWGVGIRMRWMELIGSVLER
jgi:hypothetical protein